MASKRRVVAVHGESGKWVISLGLDVRMGGEFDKRVKIDGDGTTDEGARAMIAKVAIKSVKRSDYHTAQLCQCALAQEWKYK